MCIVITLHPSSSSSVFISFSY